MKVILGQPKQWDGSALLRRLVHDPATARRQASRICELLMGESLDAGAIDQLATGLLEHDLDTGWGIAKVLRSRAFFADANMGSRVLGPVEFVVGAVRALGCSSTAPGTLRLTEWIKRMGQELFDPPNVGGWAGGREWLSSRGLIARSNFATWLVSGSDVAQNSAVDALELARRIGPADQLDQVVAAISEIVLGYQPSREWCQRVARAACRNSPPLAAAARTTAALILSSTEAQLG
jgi:uncharacterized protein (DUF1800 family)